MRKRILLFELFATAYLTLVTEIDGWYIHKLLLLSWLETKKTVKVKRQLFLFLAGNCSNFIRNLPMIKNKKKLVS